jgi:hypothetical protein
VSAIGVVEGMQDDLRLLGGRGTVKIDEWAAVHGPSKQRKVTADGRDVESRGNGCHTSIMGTRCPQS